jgi:DNA-binding IclR family transcriptional regulator
MAPVKKASKTGSGSGQIANASLRSVKPRSNGAHGVQSAETVLEVLSAFVGATPMPMLKNLAERTGMHPAKVHRYLVSLVRRGYVEQDEATSRYRLGPASLRLSFATMNSVDAIRVARPLLADFCNRIRHTVVLALWNATGPTIAARETLPGLLAMTVTEGYTLPLLRSSIGNVFGAYLPRAKTDLLIGAELAVRPAGGGKSMQEVEALFDDTRRRGLARTTGQFNLGSHSFAAPVFDALGALAAVLCAVGPAGVFDSSWKSPTAVELRTCAAEISQRLGYEDKRV